MSFLLLIVSHLVLMACASKIDFSTMENDEWTSYVEKFMLHSFGYMQHIVDNEEFILILGDVDGESNELSIFLTGDRNYTPLVKIPFDDEVPQPYFIVASDIDVLFINMPNFDEFHSVHIDFMLAFMHKLIFERARKLKVWLVIPDEWEKEITRFSKLVVRLVAVLDENLEDMLSSITLVGAIPPKPEHEVIPTDYVVLRKDRTGGRRPAGGVLLAILPHLQPRRQTQLETTAEAVWAEVTVSNLRFLIASVYRAPNSTPQQNE
ncbi:Hypothetical predicted protein [Cloeon dipterum]|uniref:Uncharacterized protein n=1 Tax=Cloeon dipterum TaxID=197152 RepID=A0A8S1E608_9INSE|nr:Hypothetical predicted protein [Cloeon dipterum]